MKMRTRLAALLVAVGLFPGSIDNAPAQVLYGSVVVEARDQSGGAVPGAEVTITQRETGWTRSGVTNDVGIATFSTVPPGTFAVKVNIQGFKESLTNGVAVT